MALVRYFVLAIAGGLLSAAQLGAQGAMGAITGRVVDSASNQGIAAVTVRIEGTARGTVTGDDGTYMLGSVPVGSARVRAARIGYAPQVRDVTVAAGAPVTANFSLTPAGVILEPVVTTGYGTQRREAITGSVATVSADEANVGVVTNANDMIQGRVAGVEMTTNNGEPGAAAQIRIRGGTSISASNEPLYVIDGVPISNAATEATGVEVGGSQPALPRSPLNLLNPSDIESITILKDASATAIYGSRAANGVILIQTKKGPTGGGSTIEYDGYVAMSQPSTYLELVSGEQYRQFVTAERDRVAAVPLAQRDTALLRIWNGVIGSFGQANTDWERELTRRAVTHNHNLSFSGGREDTRYRASLNYMDQEGIVLQSGFKRVQGRLNASHHAFQDRLRMGINLTASHLTNDYLPFEDEGGFEGAVFTNVAIFNPTQPVRTTNAEGKTVYFEIPGQTSIRNPVALAVQIIDEAKTTRALGNVVGELDLMPGLTAQVNAGADRSESVRQTYFPNENPIGSLFHGLARQVDRNLTSKTLQTLLTYRNQLLDVHAVDIVGGYEFNEYDTEEFGAEGRDFVTDLFTFSNLGGARTRGVFSWREDSRLVSFFGRANYSYNETYYVTGVLRRDGASQFGAGNKWALFPAVSASWRLTKGDFLPSYFSELRLRAGWGKQGNAAVKPYQSLLLLGPGNRAGFGSNPVTAITQTQNANPNLKWEETRQINFAVDYGLFNNRFAGTLEYYRKNTEDLLLEVDVPQPANFPTRLENIGKLRNSGIEFSLDALAMARQNFTWQAGLVFAAEQNEVVDLGTRTFITSGAVSGQGQSGQRSQRIMPGHPLGTFFGPVYVGVDPQGRQLFKCGTPSTSCVNGQTRSPSADDYEVLGDANPDFTLGLRSQMNWRRFDASFLIRSEFGQEVFNNGALVYSTKGNALQGKNFLEAALSDPIGAREPAIFSSRWIEDGSFVRLQNVTLGYTLDIPAFFGGAARPVRVYVSGDNLFLITDYTGYDPEVHTDAGLASRGIEYVTYPRARTFTAGFRVQF
jgi:TonB-linked SusC/RagA family outer membrane protein